MIYYIYSKRKGEFKKMKKQYYTSEVEIPTKEGDYLYFIQIGDPEERLFKIGTTNNINRRMLEHRRTYKKDIHVLWVSPTYKKSTTLLVENKMKATWKEQEGMEYIPKDRFIINENIQKITIKVRKEYVIKLE